MLTVKHSVTVSMVVAVWWLGVEKVFRLLKSHSRFDFCYTIIICNSFTFWYHTGSGSGHKKCFIRHWSDSGEKNLQEITFPCPLYAGWDSFGLSILPFEESSTYCVRKNPKWFRCGVEWSLKHQHGNIKSCKVWYFMPKVFSQ